MSAYATDIITHAGQENTNDDNNNNDNAATFDDIVTNININATIGDSNARSLLMLKQFQQQTSNIPQQHQLDASTLNCADTVRQHYHNIAAVDEITKAQQDFVKSLSNNNNKNINIDDDENNVNVFVPPIITRPASVEITTIMTNLSTSLDAMHSLDQLYSAPNVVVDDIKVLHDQLITTIADEHTLNVEQRKAFHIIARAALHTIAYNRVKFFDHQSTMQPPSSVKLQLFGAGGTGKSAAAMTRIVY